MKEVEVELVEAPNEESQFVLWRELCSRADSKQKVIDTPKALDAVVEGVDETDQSRD